MLYSTSISEITAIQDYARSENNLYHTQDERQTPYFILPRNAAVAGRVVVAYANLHSNGYLRDEDAEFDPVDQSSDETLEIYGVIPEPLSPESGLADNEKAVILAQQNHIRAERLWIDYGILTPNGRRAAELAVLNTLGGTHRREHLAHRIAHLKAVHGYIQHANEPKSVRDKAVKATESALIALHSPKLVG